LARDVKKKNSFYIINKEGVCVDVKLGINAGFAINRFPEPEVWTRLVGEEFGLRYVQFVADLLNPFLPKGIIDDQISRIQEGCSKYDLNIVSTFTSAFTRVNHLMHPDKAQRDVWLGWFKDWARISVRLGAKSMGSHFGILSVKDCNDATRRDFLIDEAVKAWQELARYGKDIGLEFLIFEPMSVPREMAWTIAESRELLDRVNQDAAIPMRLCLDLGHAPHPDQRDPYVWLRELGSVSPIIHIQQTEFGHSRHWPFTDQYNKVGIVHPERVLSVLEESGAKEAILFFEISHRERYPDDLKVVDELRESVQYWRSYIKD
jgi:sugar phosphate isomerase/epimerase